MYHFEEYYHIKLNKKFTALYDNKAYVKNFIYQYNTNTNSGTHKKNNEPEALTIMLKFNSKNFTIQQVYGHQSNNPTYSKLSIQA